MMNFYNRDLPGFLKPDRSHKLALLSNYSKIIKGGS